MKNTQMYNPYNLNVVGTSKLAYMALPKAPQPNAQTTLKASQEHKKEYMASADALKKEADKLDKSNEFAALEELETGAGSKFLSSMKKSIADQLKGYWQHANSNQMTKEERQIQFQSVVNTIKGQLANAPTLMNDRANSLYTQKETAADMYYSKTFPNKKLAEMAKDLVANSKEKLTAEVVDLVTELGFQATIDSPVRIADLVMVKGAIVRDPKNPKHFILNENNPEVKKYEAQIKKAMAAALGREIARRKMLPEASARYLVGQSVNENPKSRAALEDLAKKVANRVKKGLVPVNLRLSSMTSVEGRGNDALAKKRANSQKAAMAKLLTKYVGKDWQKKVKITVLYGQVQPEIKSTDLPKKLRDSIRKGAQNVSTSGGDLLKDHLTAMNNIKNPQERLYTILSFMAGTPEGKDVLREYNTYIALVIKGDVVASEAFLRKNAKFINKPAILNYLHKTVGRSRSTEVKLMTPELFAAVIKNISSTMASRYPGHNVKTIKGEIFINEVTSGDPSKEKLVLRLKPNADASKFVAYGPDNKRKAEYTVAEIEGGKMDKMFA